MPQIFFIQQDVDSLTRDHERKFAKTRPRLLVRSCFFSNSVVNIWDRLLKDFVTMQSVAPFKQGLDWYWYAMYPELRQQRVKCWWVSTVDPTSLDTNCKSLRLVLSFALTVRWGFLFSVSLGESYRTASGENGCYTGVHTFGSILDTRMARDKAWSMKTGTGLNWL